MGLYHNDSMTRIRLKPNSALFADDDEKKAPSQHRCDMPGCTQEGSYKAPRDRNLSGHFMFCLEHIQEYNKAWDYFSGMSAREIEEHLVKSALWDRPTRRYDGRAALEEELKRKSWQAYNFTDKEPPKEEQKKQHRPSIDHNTPEFQALAIMGLEPPLNLPIIKTRYKELVKKHHPDVNRGNPDSEELLKSINMAYTILKMALEKFEKLPTR